MTPPRFSKPPRALRRPHVQLDNIALVPASLLPFKAQWQQIANRLPQGGVLLCSRTTNIRQRGIIARVAARLKAKGLPVVTITTEQLAGVARR